MPNHGLRPILLIDDNHEDLFLTKRLLARAGIKHPIITIDDGEEAIAFLRAAAAPGASDLLPCAVFCDIRMPKIDGFDVVKWARNQPALARTPIVMLTGGDVPEDRARAKSLGVTYFLVKFPNPDVLKQIVEGTCPAQ
jgi:CheY-like chemotaxis protein